MWAQFKKFAPLGVILGYLFVYMNKGWDRIVTDMSTITVAKLQAKWQQILMVVVAGAILYVVGKVKMPAALKTFVLIFLYVFIGYNTALVIDPVGCGGQYEPACTAGWVTPKARNPYAPGAK
jgi:zinc transporter ZupT